MNLWQALDAWGERSAARRHDLLERGLDARSLLKEAIGGLDAKLLIAASIIALFATSYFREADKDTRNLMVGALIAAFAGAWGYYLGSSNNAAKANDRADLAIDTAAEAVKKLPPPPPAVELELEPGEQTTIAAKP